VAGVLALNGLEVAAVEELGWSVALGSSFSGVDLPNLAEKGFGAEAVQTGFSPAPATLPVRQNGLVEGEPDEPDGADEAKGLFFSPPDPPETAANLLALSPVNSFLAPGEEAAEAEVSLGAADDFAGDPDDPDPKLDSLEARRMFDFPAPASAEPL